ncbi:MAG: hypothetical protein KJ970_18105 [Candidatus Eisenbacteria bacterium]|uniref:Uncharacterized protein n=1 Tax=Eiseniibacteriota bacterium TaxID=2212470 RepID=A0A948RZI9_UNCEI|nr:hypothetical protein [Candidatus Eisenbacteria bacterium]MBU1948381.1 hypothetical protein [Candidatus Eisenbacteria bacterium]MBU2692836.1 hypothetical protein [Candidatus Eisenbacteria bacterium]
MNAKHKLGGGALGAWTILGVTLLVLLFSASPPCADEVTACVGGTPGYLSVGDTLMFLGDCQSGTVYNCTIECDCFAGCWNDTGFGFQKVTNVDLETCSGSLSTKYCVTADGCFWLGIRADETVNKQCEPCLGTSNRYCLSLWDVTSYNAAPGDQTQGCYTLTLLCDDPDDDCSGDPVIPDEYCLE